MQRDCLLHLWLEKSEIQLETIHRNLGASIFLTGQDFKKWYNDIIIEIRSWRFRGKKCLSPCHPAHWLAICWQTRSSFVPLLRGDRFIRAWRSQLLLFGSRFLHEPWGAFSEEEFPEINLEQFDPQLVLYCGLSPHGKGLCTGNPWLCRNCPELSN